MHNQITQYRYKGRRFFICARCDITFAAKPTALLTALEMRSVLFDEQSITEQAVSSLWLWLGIYVLVGLVCAATCGYIAIGQSRSALGWFSAGLMVNFLAVLIVICKSNKQAVPPPRGLVKLPTTHTPVTCPQCHQPNHPCATTCTACGGTLTPHTESELARL